MGAVDLVVQVESPGSVARGLQRIGRAGHHVGMPSRGRIFPKYRGDLLEAAAVVPRMEAGLVEETRYLRNPLDVLAQQVVAACALDEWDVDTLAAMVRRTATFADLSDDAFHAVLDLLAGRYPSDEFSGLKPRLVWDRTAGRVRARDGAGRVAITNGGTIPDRGLFGVFLPDGMRVGELDEEMVYESRPGDTFTLGASTWRIQEITHARVVVTPAPGEPARMPFWHGDKPGRPAELGRAVGATVRDLVHRDPDDARERLERSHHLDGRAAQNLLTYLDDQRTATGVVPDDRTVVVERFPDEIGDWRICILTPFGARVHAPWAMAIEERLAERLDLEVDILWSDDGIALRLPEAIEDLPLDELLVDPDDVEDLVVRRLPATALFAARFREASARALLLPRRRPGERTPLWQQRKKAADLLQVAGRYPDFPMLLETARECLRDVFDLPALREVLQGLRDRTIRAVSVDTPKASPFAQSLLFGWIATYMYEGDAPLAERRAVALALDRDLLRELLGSDELRELIDAEALAALELELQWLAPGGRRVRSADDLHDLLRDVGDLRDDEIAARSEVDADPLLGQLLGEHRAIRIRVAGEARVAAAEDAARFRDALGAATPRGLPGAFVEPVADPMADLVARYAEPTAPSGWGRRDPARGRGRTGAPRPRPTRGIRSGRGRRVPTRRARAGVVRRRGAAPAPTSLARDSARRSNRSTTRPSPASSRRGRAWAKAGAARRAARGDRAAPGSVRPGIGARIRRARRTRLRLPAVRPRRAADGRRGRVDRGRRHRCERRPGRPLLPRRRALVRACATHRAPRRTHRRRAACAPRRAPARRFWPDLVRAGRDRRRAGRARRAVGPRVGGRGHQRRRSRRCGRWPGRSPGAAPPRAGPGRVACTRLGPPTGAGRWSLVAALRRPGPRRPSSRPPRATQLLTRHGVVTREAVKAEGRPRRVRRGLPRRCRMLEESGPGPARLLRRRPRRGPVRAARCRRATRAPGAPTPPRPSRRGPRGHRPGPALRQPRWRGRRCPSSIPPSRVRGRPPRPARTAGAVVVLRGGAPVAFLDPRGHHLLAYDVDDLDWVDGAPGLVHETRVRRLEIRR